MPDNDQTLQFYNGQASDYAAHEPGLLQSEQLEKFASSLKPGAQVLDLGSGGGHAALALINSGFRVTLVDGSAGLAKEAEKKTGQDVRVLSFEELDYIDQFDGAWASASLHHVHSAVLPAVLEKVSLSLKHGGILFASFKEAEADWHDRLGRYFCAMTADRLQQYAEQSGFVIEAIERSRGHGYDGSATRWLTLTARRCSEGCHQD